MATKTTTDVVTMALQIMNVIGAGETPSAEDSAVAEAVYQALHEDMRVEYADLYKSARVSWNRNAVPEEWYAHVAALLAGRLAPGFAKASATGKENAIGAAEIADRAIRRRLARYNPDATRFDEAMSPRYSTYGGNWR